MTSLSQAPAMRTTEVQPLATGLPTRSARLVWGSFALALLMLIGVCIVFLKQLGSSYSDFAPLILANQTALRANYIASEARMVNQLLEQIALRHAAEGRKLDLKALVRQGVIDPNIIAKVQIFDARGDLQLSSIETPPGINLRQTPAFMAHATTDSSHMFVEARAFASGNPQDFAGFSRRLSSRNGMFAGVVVANLKADHIKQAFNDVQMRFDGNSHLVNLSGEIGSTLLSQDPKTILDYKDHPFLKLISEGITHGSYERWLPVDGINRIFVFHKIPDLDFVVVSSVAARGWDGILLSTKRVLYAVAATLLAALLMLVLTFRSHSIRLNHALAQKVQLAEQLRTSEERLSLAVTGGRLGTWDWHLHDKKFRTNELFKALFTPWPEKISLQSGGLQEQLHPEDLESFMRSLKQHLRGASFDFSSECRIRDAAGDWKWVSVMGRVTERGADRGPLRISGTVTDISEQRALQTKINDHSNQLSTIFSLSQDALVVFDQSRRVKFVNPAFKRLAQLEPSSLLGLDEAQFTNRLNSVCEPGKHFCGLNALRESGQPTVAKSGQQLVLQGPVSRVLLATLTTSQSNSVFQILSLRDVTNETLIEKLKSEFLSTAAHEIRSPMSSILGFAELMTDSELNASDRREYSNIILSQANRIKGLLDELLDLARIDANGDQHFDFEPVDLHELVTTVVTEFMPPDGRPAPIIHVPSQHCLIDFDKAAQALLNVMSNAFKYSDKTSPISIRLAPPTVINHQDMAGITVQDFGIGMTQAEVERIFERFYRANQKSAVAGSGLGMAIVKEIMTKHGGDVRVQSAPGQGTTVTLLFPTLKQTEQNPALLAASEIA